MKYRFAPKKLLHGILTLSNTAKFLITNFYIIADSDNNEQKSVKPYMLLNQCMFAMGLQYKARIVSQVTMCKTVSNIRSFPFWYIYVLTSVDSYTDSAVLFKHSAYELWYTVD